MTKPKDDDRPPGAEICDIHSFGATAARAFAALTAVEPEPAPAPVVQPAPARPTRGLSAEAIRRIADRAEAAARKKGDG